MRREGRNREKVEPAIFRLTFLLRWTDFTMYKHLFTSFQTRNDFFCKMHKLVQDDFFLLTRRFHRVKVAH